ncbi:quinol dehydrogenase membrane component, partial [Haemophilus influenzae]
ALILACGF